MYGHVSSYSLGGEWGISTCTADGTQSLHLAFCLGIIPGSTPGTTCSSGIHVRIHTQTGLMQGTGQAHSTGDQWYVFIKKITIFPMLLAPSHHMQKQN